MAGSEPSELAIAAGEAKFQRPVHRPGLVARTKLLEALAAAPDQASLILLAAPAGYGKTTVLSQWAAVDSREFGWVTVDEADNDPVRLAGHVALALHRIEALDPAVFRALAVGDGSRHLVALRTCSLPCGIGAGPVCWCSTTSTSCTASRRGTSSERSPPAFRRASTSQSGPG